MAGSPNDKVAGALRILRFLHAALLLSQLLLVVLLVYISAKSSVDASEVRPFFPFLVLAVTVFNTIGGTKMFESRLQLLPADGSEEAITQHRQASIFRYALLEGATIFNGIAFLVMDSIVFLCVIAGILAFFVYIRPTTKRMRGELQVPDTSEQTIPIT